VVSKITSLGPINKGYKEKDYFSRSLFIGVCVLLKEKDSEDQNTNQSQFNITTYNLKAVTVSGSAEYPYSYR
jgi:hypothetical protein